MSVLSFVVAVALYTIRYVALVYFGKHVTGVLYGDDASEEEMAWLWSKLHRKFRESPKVVVVSCMDARLVAFGQLFLHVYMFWVARRALGASPILYGISGAGPSVDMVGNEALALAHRQSIFEGAQTAGAAMIIVTGHEHCARDRRSDAEKANGTIALALDLQRKLQNTKVVAYYLYARYMGWRPAKLGGQLHSTADDDALSNNDANPCELATF